MAITPDGLNTTSWGWVCQVYHRRAFMERTSEQRTSDEMVRLIQKLRWVGLEGEAKSMQRELTARAVPAGDSVIATPHETD